MGLSVLHFPAVVSPPVVIFRFPRDDTAEGFLSMDPVVPTRKKYQTNTTRTARQLVVRHHQRCTSEEGCGMGCWHYAAVRTTATRLKTRTTKARVPSPQRWGSTFWSAAPHVVVGSEKGVLVKQKTNSTEDEKDHAAAP